MSIMTFIIGSFLLFSIMIETSGERVLRFLNIGYKTYTPRKKDNMFLAQEEGLI